ncbi:MAG: reverse transcriptase/maturase family protein [Spongiibacteraceae bacterium]
MEMAKRKGTPKWFKSRGYPHFDKPVSFNTINKLVSDPLWVKRHAFYPFISYIVTTQKITKDNASGKAIAKPPKRRPISYASHIDSHIYAYYAEILQEKYEQALRARNLQNSVLAFRRLGKSNIDFANQAFEEVIQRGTCGVVALDVTGFFDNLDHELLKSAWKNILDTAELPDDHYAVFKSITKYSSVMRGELYALLKIPASRILYASDGICTAKEFRELVRSAGKINQNREKKGIPQGSPISALLSNIYMLDFDTEIQKTVDDVGGVYFRYCDDILIIVQLPFLKDIEDYVENKIKEWKLEVNVQKTETTTFAFDKKNKRLALTSKKPMQYLGFTFDGERKLIRSAALAKYSNRMKSGVSLAMQTARKHNTMRVTKGIPQERIYRRGLYEKYSHLGKRNFVTYALKASRAMQSKSIRKQVKPLWARLRKEIYLLEDQLKSSTMTF